MRPQIVVNPRSDDAFANAAQYHVVNGVESAADMERLLRVQFPRVVVRERELTGERHPTWYVYREGSWVPEGASET